MGDRRPRGHPRCGRQSSGSSGQEGEAERQAATSVGLAMSPRRPHVVLPGIYGDSEL